MNSKDIQNQLTNKDLDMNALLQIVSVIWLRHELENTPDLDSDSPADIKLGREWKKRIEALETLITNPKLVQRAWLECGQK